MTDKPGKILGKNLTTLVTRLNICYQQAKVQEFGIDKNNMFAFWDVSIIMIALRFSKSSFLFAITVICNKFLI